MKSRRKRERTKSNNRHNGIVGKVIQMHDRHYVYVNDAGTRERLPKIKWYARLWIEILEGFNKRMSISELREFANKYEKRSS